jgi:hypothetical protein
MLLKYLAPEGGTGMSPPLARLGETANNNHAAVMNTVFKSNTSEVEFMKRLTAGPASSPMAGVKM